MKPLERQIAGKAIRERQSVGTIQTQASWTIGQFVNSQTWAMPFSGVFHVGCLRYYLKLRVG